MLRTRNRLVNFRLTEMEYAKVQSALVSQGVRCLSDFAREAVLRHADDGANGAGSVQSQMTLLSHRIVDLESTVRQLESLLSHLSAKPELDRGLIPCP